MENLMKTIKERHEIHGASIGVVLYLLTKNIGLSVILGGGAYAWMRKFEHRTDVTLEEIENIFQ